MKDKDNMNVNANANTIGECTNMEYYPNSSMPLLPHGGAIVQVCFAGACYSDCPTKRSGDKLRHPGIRDTSLFPGFEISGIIQAICPSVPNHNWQVGDKVIVFPDEKFDQARYQQYIAIKDVNQLVHVPNTLPLEVAALLPSGGLTAYNALERAMPTVEARLKRKGGRCKMFIIGAGGLGLWTVRIARQILGSRCEQVDIYVADCDIEKLMLALDYGCTDVVNWDEQEYEQELIEKASCVCRQPCDIIIDYVSSPRSMSRSMKLLGNNGLLLVGGNSKYTIPVCLSALAEKGQSIVGVRRGTIEQLTDLVYMVADKLIVPPNYSTFPVSEATQVYQDLSNSKILGRAVLQVAQS